MLFRKLGYITISFVIDYTQYTYPMETRPKIVVIVGTTATGKSDLAVLLARKFGGEVVSADSRQIYRGLDLGTGKITKTEMRGVPHHMLDIADPRRPYSAARFQRNARRIIRDILRRGKLPIVAGGTGFYIDALVYDMEFPNVKPNFSLRKTLEKLPLEDLSKRLERLDPHRRKTIDAKNRVRLIRAIEIATLYGPIKPIVTSSPYNILWLGIATNKEDLKERVVRRIQKRIRRGMFREFEHLHKNGLSLRRMEELGLEYRHGARYLCGEIDRATFVSDLARDILRYAKRQMTWFKRNKEIHWLSPDRANEAESIVAKFLMQRKT